MIPALITFLQLPNCSSNLSTIFTCRQLEKETSHKYFLVDNGSRRPESILYMRNVAFELKITGFSVTPCGIMHSHKVDASKLDGKPGMSMESFFLSNEASSKKSFISTNVSWTQSCNYRLVARKINEWESNGNNRKFSIADCLFQKKDIRIAKALAEYVVDLIPQYSPQKPFCYW